MLDEARSWSGRRSRRGHLIGHAEHRSTLIPLPPATPNAATVRLSVTGPDQALMEPLREILVTQFAACDSCDDLRNYRVTFDELIAASLRQ